MQAGIEILNSTCVSGEGLITIPFNIEEDDNYTIYGRLNYPTYDDDSFLHGLLFYLTPDDFLFNRITVKLELGNTKLQLAKKVRQENSRHDRDEVNNVN